LPERFVAANPEPPVSARYNRVVRFLSVVLAALLMLAGCSKKNIDTLDAVKQGVVKGIPKDINLGAMDVNVVSVSFRGQEADAVVSFATKGGPPMMTMNYTMERVGDEWKIKKRAASDVQKHAGAAQAPMPSEPPVPAPGPGAGAPGGMNLPPNHPAMDGGESKPASGAMPPGHPTMPGGAK